MLLNATCIDGRLEVDDYELNSNDNNYTYNSLKYFSDKYSDWTLYLIMGSDNFRTFSTWYRYQEILKLANLIVLTRYTPKSCDKIGLLERESEKIKDKYIREFEANILIYNKKTLEISSTVVRELIKNNASIHEFLDVENIRFIKLHGLYK